MVFFYWWMIDHHMTDLLSFEHFLASPIARYPSKLRFGAPPMVDTAESQGAWWRLT
jgi:hypothetical protein